MTLRVGTLALCALHHSVIFNLPKIFGTLFPKRRLTPLVRCVMVNREYLLKQAEKCLRLARGATADDVAQNLRDLAAEYQAKAQEQDDARKSDKDK